MILKNIYPKTTIAFRNWYMINPKWEFIYNSLGRPRPFDVSLRDGLQGLTNNEQKKFTLEKKINLYNEVFFNYKPKSIEIGSLVSKKLLPIFSDTIELKEYIDNIYDKNNTNNKINTYLNINEKIESIYGTNNYILVPNNKNLLSIIKNNYKHINFSFITSLSNSFQYKNTKMNIDKNEKEIEIMLKNIKDYKLNISNIKLYVSCINECPIEGMIPNDLIVVKLLKYHKLGFENICLSDTCGSLKPNDFEYIIDNCNNHGLNYKKFSLHLHIKPEREEIVEKIIHKALDRKIINFDVSLLGSEDCSLTMSKPQITYNLTYDLYFKSLCSYIENKSKEL